MVKNRVSFLSFSLSLLVVWPSSIGLEDQGREGFITLPGWIVSLVAFCLSFDVVVSISTCVYDGAAPVICHKDHCHIVDGLLCSVFLDSFPGSYFPKITFSYYMHESTTEL